MQKVAVLISGGVDSSVALRLVKEQGFDVTAFYIKIWLEDELSFLGSCPWQEDLSYVEAVCKQAQVPLEIISLQEEYHKKVIAYALEVIKKGQTPNPDILCNTLIKFGAFYDAVGHKFDKVVTGHYAGLTEKDGIFYLVRTPDELKDQTYFLAQLSQKQLSKIIFPLGNLKKREVRDLAQKYDLANKDRKDSQGLCFLGKIKFRDFIKSHIGSEEGLLKEYETGTVMGKHEGFWFYTVGQRQGIGLSGGPWYVVGKDVLKNEVFISKNYYDADKERNSFKIAHPNWFDGTIVCDTPLLVKVRHGQYLHKAVITDLKDGSYFVTLQERDQGIAAGQFAVFYKDTLCLGSAVIID